MESSAKRGIFLAPFDELADPRTLAELARIAEGSGWAGFFLGTTSHTGRPFEPSPIPGWRWPRSPARRSSFGSGRW